ncbi:MAG TPA: hypothetical protein VN673_15850 [Clostridia bacterium]|nr:hypothetical protein [Clostridia bacterium]
MVPHPCGEPVEAEILVLPDGVSIESAKDMVWRREVGQEGSGRPYLPKSSPDSVLVKDASGVHGLPHVLYTDFNESGKIAKPTAELLASAAVSSVPKAKIGRDGISYLMQVKASGVETKLTSDYEAKILRATGSETLLQALAGLQGEMLERRFETALSDLAGASATGGRLARIEDNLIPGIQLEDFQADLLASAGKELDEHFYSSRSSSALAVNNFAYFRKRPNDLGLLEVRGVRSLSFEKRLPTGLGGTAPHVDVWVETANGPIAIESKLLEYFPRTESTFVESYRRSALPQAEDCWWGVLETCQNRKTHLKTAQLVKHYLGLKRWADENPSRKATLLYLFWEPLDASDLAVCRQHREEIRRLEQAVIRSTIHFRAMSYPELWQEWQSTPSLTHHVQNLRKRYAVCLPRTTS